MPQPPPPVMQPPQQQPPPVMQPPQQQPPVMQPPQQQPAATPRAAAPAQPTQQGFPPPAPPAPPPVAPVPMAYLAGPGATPARDTHGFVAFAQLSLRRALRLRIEPDELTPDERAQLAHAGVTHPVFQSFLAWRRSVVFMVAALLVPLIILKAVEIFDLPDATSAAERSALATIQGLQSIPLLAEIAFCALAWVQLRNWTDWRRQRRSLAIGWAVYFLAPFVIYLYPLRSLADDMFAEGGVTGAERKAAVVFVGLIWSLQAMMTLAPKAVSLIPGLVRASLVSKFLFPGSAAPGWLMVLAAPIYAVLVYVVLIVPYQITGSGWFVLAILGIGAAEYLLARGGLELARPMTHGDAVAIAHRARRSYLIAMAVGALCLVVALGSVVRQLDFEALTVVNLIGTFLASVWILTVITTDLVIVGLDRARGLTAGTSHLVDESNRQLAAFVGAVDPHDQVRGDRPTPPDL